MKAKTKISNAVFVAATKCIGKCREYMSDDAGSFIDIMGVFFVHGEMIDCFRPFDMIANGSVIGGVSDAVWSAFFDEWMGFISLLEKDDSHEDLYTAFVMMCGMIVGCSRGFSQAAFTGVYGSFRVALAKCLKSRAARVRGGKSVVEEIESLKRRFNDKEDVAWLRSLGNAGKTRGDYLEMQYQIFKKLYVEKIKVKMNGERVPPKVCGEKGILCDVWKTPEFDFELGGKSKRVPIPKNAGMVDADWRGETRLYQNWIRRAEHDGWYISRRNKPGAGGARRMK